jgi:hypothetical protein
VKDIAYQITLRDYGLLEALPVGELLRKKFTEAETSPHLSYIVDTFNVVWRVGGGGRAEGVEGEGGE